MRTRIVAAMTAALLAAPFVTAAAQASPSHKCPNAVAVEHKCGGKGKG